MIEAATIDAADRAIIAATQEGLPLVSQPFAEIARATGLSTKEVMSRLKRMQRSAIIRRIAAVPNHYSLGLRFNGMTVWDVEDAEVAALGRKVGALDFVTHCYRRPRVDGIWPYNLFAMVHGGRREEVEGKASRIANLLGRACRASDILYSKRILKKTGLRLQG
jgi:DNA-binding Lrp family transcriptional regulator